MIEISDRTRKIYCPRGVAGRHLSSNVGYDHSLLSADHYSIRWPLPRMFGIEQYAYSVLDVTDEQYKDTIREMNIRLRYLHYEEQIIDVEWRRTLQSLLNAERNKSSSTIIAGFRERLTELQKQKDLYHAEKQSITQECSKMWKSILHARRLVSLRKSVALKRAAKMKQAAARSSVEKKSIVGSTCSVAPMGLPHGQAHEAHV